MSELYGYFDEDTNEWHDGLVSSLMRGFLHDNSKTKKWMVFDGHMDAV